MNINWRGTQEDSRRRYLEKYDTAEADQWDSWIGAMCREDIEAYH